MIAFKRMSYLSFALLTACAPTKMLIQPENKAPVMQTENASIKGQKTELSIANPSSAKVPSSWDLSGAIAARNKNKAWTASINWLQSGPGAYQIRLFGPLGSGAIMIEKQGGVVSFRDGPKSAKSTNADELLKQQTGIRLPVNNLYYWVRGIPAPGAVQSATHSSTNQLTLLRQSGYTIEYLSFTKSGNTVLPSLIKLTGNGIFIKLVIKRWKI
jgi:outer membrane lipoprotein LolB